MSEEIKELSKKQKLAINITAGGILVSAGVFILLCGVIGAMPNILRVLPMTILIAFCLVFLVPGIVQKNPVSIWIAVMFFVPVIVELAAKYSDVVDYRQLYPLYIAAPAIASLITAVCFFKFKAHLPVIVLFFSAALIFVFKVSGLFNFDTANGWIMAPVLLFVLLALSVVYLVVKIRKARREE